jgi:hypothetical protein
LIFEIGKTRPVSAFICDVTSEAECFFQHSMVSAEISRHGSGIASFARDLDVFAKTSRAAETYGFSASAMAGSSPQDDE